MRTSKHFYILIIILFFCAIIATGQRVDYQGGYFEKVGNRWNEYRPQEKSGVHNYFNQIDDQKDWWVLDNGNCRVAIPKNPSVDNILIKLPGQDWKYKYTATGIRNYHPNSNSNKSASANKTKSTNSNSNNSTSVNKTKSTKRNDGRVTCEKCHGTGTMTCPSCGGKGSKSRCILCHGTGRGIGNMRCSTCGGDGVQKCMYCSNRGTCKCFICNGRGWYTNATLQADAQKGRALSEESKRLLNENRNAHEQTRNNREQGHVCSVCGGTGVGNMDDSVKPDGIAPSNIKYTNRAGNLCPICGSRKYHAHFKCGGCRGSGR